MNKLFYGCLAALVLVALPIPAQTNSWLVSSFETSSDLAVISTNNTTIFLSTNGVTLGQYSGCVTFNPSAWPNVYFKSGVAFTNLDWQSRGGMAVDVLNTNAAPISIFIRVDDDFSANGVVHCQTASLSFPAAASGTIVMAFPQSAVTNMRTGPPLVASNALSTSVYGPVLNWSNIVAFQIFLASPTNPTTLFFDNLRLLPVPNLNGIVDAYGQYTGADWPGKIHQDTDLTNQNSQEQQWIAVHPRPADRDVYGAWQAGPQLAASGWFRTAWVAGTNEVAPGSTNRGRWWLVAPSGRLFFSFGIDVIDYGETTAVSGRENLFSWLPGVGDPLANSPSRAPIERPTSTA
jgi:agarase